MSASLSWLIAVSMIFTVLLAFTAGRARTGESSVKVEADQSMLGRYRITTGESQVYKIDTVTGKSWILRTIPRGFDAPEYQWVEIK